MESLNGDVHAFTLKTTNQNVQEVEYAILGPISVRAREIISDLKNGIIGKRDFEKIIPVFTGDPQAVGQRPITFIRQVIACTTDTSLLESDLYPTDVKDKARLLLDNFDGRSIGSYTNCRGSEIIRRHVAEYIAKRDGFPCDYLNVFLNDATGSIRMALELFNDPIKSDKPIGVMVGIPQYPIYSATIKQHGMYQIDYYLDEENDWELNVVELQKILEESKQHCRPRILVVINPGNPTGSVLSKDNIEKAIKFAKHNNLMIIADEVYQHNVYEGEFHSFKKVMCELGIKLELTSLMSLSKGYTGECGLRGGYTELFNYSTDIRANFMKLVDIKMPCTSVGQIGLDCVVKPPEKGQPSYELFKKEKDDILNDLKRKAEIVSKSFNKIPGIKCNKINGSLYAFPRLELPRKAIEKANSLNLHPDTYYALELLESTGIWCTPGNGFGQIEGTYHLRTTIIPETEIMEEMMEKLEKFHLNFIKRFE